MSDPVGTRPPNRSWSLERRRFLSAITGSLLAAPLANEGQRAGNVYQISLLNGLLFFGREPGRIKPSARGCRIPVGSKAGMW